MGKLGIVEGIQIGHTPHARYIKLDNGTTFWCPSSVMEYYKREPDAKVICHIPLWWLKKNPTVDYEEL